MQGSIVQAATADHVRLHGMLCEPQPTRGRVLANARGPLTAVVLVHGLAGNFYSSRLLNHVAEMLYEMGVSVLLVNTRGHDMVNTISWSGSARSVGAAFERVSNGQHDIHAWAKFMADRGHSNVMLVGHSLGAIKSLYTQAFNAHPAVSAIVALSATRLSYQSMLASPGAEKFQATIERCQNECQQGRGEEMIQVDFPFSTWMTPAGYLEKYGPEENYNWLNFIDRVENETLLLFGGRELSDNPAFHGLAEQLKVLQRGFNPRTVEIIPDADHFYTSKFDQVSDHITRWLS